MTFLNPALTFGALAFAIPLIIHILNRRRFRTVEWGAMHLLESVIKVNHRRFRIDQLILLLVRCVIPVLLAVCLARPVLTGARLLEGDAPVSLVMLLDTSYSMDTTGPSGSRFDSAVDAACRILRAAGKGSEVAVIQTGGRPTPLFDQPVFDPEAVIRRLKQIPAGYGASDVPASLDEAIAVLSGMNHARRELIVISDFQPADWDKLGDSGADSIRRQIEAVAVQPELTLLPVGQAVSGNVSVDSLTVPRRALGVGQLLTVRARIRNHGMVPLDQVRVIFRIDGTESAVTQTALAADGDTQLLFPCTIENAGSHVLEAEVIADDPLADDNRYAAAVTIWDGISVLLVDGDVSNQPLQSETDYLSIALTPLTFGRTQLSDLLQTRTVKPNELNADALAKVRVVVLANVSRLDASQLTALTEFVRAGGALLVCSGNRIDVNWYREHMFAGGSGLIPAAFGPLQGQIDESGRSTHVVVQHFDHAALELFNEPANGDLSSAEIRKWNELTDITADTGVMIPARLENGDPFLAEHRFGDGVVLQLATACDADWSDLPLRPLFVPLMQQLITTMASGILPPRNIRTGESAVALFPGSPAAPDTGTGVTEGTTNDSLTVSITTPDGSRRALQTVADGRRQLAKFDGTQRPGVYAMSTPAGQTQHFVAETSREESNLQVMDESRLQALSGKLGAALIRSPAEYLEQDRLRRHGREIRNSVLAVFVGFLFLELVLQQRFARVRT